MCDAWPTNPQACLWSHFFANRRKTPPTVDYKVRQSFNVTADTMGTDLVGEAFAVVDPTHVESLPPASRLTGYTDDEYLRRGILDEGRAMIVKPFSPRDLLHALREVLT